MPCIVTKIFRATKVTISILEYPNNLSCQAIYTKTLFSHGYDVIMMSLGVAFVGLVVRIIVLNDLNNMHGLTQPDLKRF